MLFRNLVRRGFHILTEKPKLKTIGIIPVTAPGGAMCYQAIVNRSIALYGGNHHPTICMHHHNFEEYHHAQSQSRWDKVAELLLDSSEKVHKAGAEFAIIPANTVHRKEILETLKQAPIPILSMLDIVADHCRNAGYQRVAILGTKWTMRDNIYKLSLEKFGIESIIPSKAEQATLQRAIIEELIPEKHTEKTVNELLKVIDGIMHRQKDSRGFALALACTELPLVLNHQNCKVPVIDTTTIQAHAAVDYSASDLQLHAKVSLGTR